MSLTGPSRPAKSGTATSQVVFLHGYGADGADLLGLADPLSEHLPDTAFYAPNAPQRSSLNPMGFQWFPIPRMDGSTEAQAMAALQVSAQALNAWLDGLIEQSGIASDRTVLVGFSQGTMISLEIAPRRPSAVAGVVGFSGRLLAPERLAGEVVSRPPVLLIHGDMDDVVPPSSLPEAADALTDAGFSVRTHLSKGMGHGIAPDGLGLALAFIRDKL
ncbi:MAG: prolyl oligopeptidase family serine peptidase [Pseudomonadota bacterium]